MFESTLRGTRVLLLVLAAGLGTLAACESPTVPHPVTGTDLGIVVNSIERSLTVFEVDAPETVFTIGLGASGSPVGAAARGEIVVVPMGTTPEAVVIDLREREVVHRVALPEGSGASGAAFLNDSIALVGNPERNTVSPVNVRTGTAGGEIEVGGYPSTLIESGNAVAVLNAELENWAPARPGTISVIGQGLTVLETIELSGLNPGDAFWVQSTLLVLNRGAWGEDNGSLSVVDGHSLREQAHYEGFGDFPGSMVPGEDGLLYISLWGEGIIAWDPVTHTFPIGRESPFTPGDTPPVSDLAIDQRWRIYVANPGTCEAPGEVYRLRGDRQVTTTIPVGVCPTSISFTEMLDG